jgi:vacuolar-type H+-ATPase subunit I/STV1
MLYFKGKMGALFAAIYLLMFLPYSAVARDLTGCDAKKQKIQTQISYAKAHHNTHHLYGLERALRRVEENCTDESLLKERQQKIREKQQKVNERKFELKDAEQFGDPKKIAKKRKKLEQAQEELADVQASLSR